MDQTNLNLTNSNMPPFVASLMYLGKEPPATIALNNYKDAVSLINKINSGEINENEIENTLRIVLEKYLTCFWYYKDIRKDISRVMHNIGVYLCKHYKCKSKFDGEYYYTECPNILLHNDFGFSLRGIEKIACSICGKEPLECEHITNQKYNKVKCLNVNNLCNICLEPIGKCKHVIGNEYNNVEMTNIVVDLKIITFDLVKDPEMVFTRITKQNFSKDQIMSELSKEENLENFEYGKSDLYCLHCVKCQGYEPGKSDILFKK